MMTYEETLEYLYNAAPAFEKVGAGAYKEGLSNTLALDEHLGYPHTQYLTIHVAGTNGKGSTSHTLAAFLQSMGYRVGLYTSPHLVDFSERIRVNGKPIEHDYVVDFVEQERDFFEPLQPSFFELTTAMAFKYFAEKKVDVAVIEVGLGGRLDCTNIIRPILSVITNISFDHTGFLGNTLSDIAREKAGIIKPRVPVVIGEYTEETRDVFISVAQSQGSQVIFAQDKPEVVSTDKAENGTKIYATASFGQMRGQLLGNYQEFNTNTALVAIRTLLPMLEQISKEKNKEDFMTLATKATAEAIAHVCDITGLMGRWQTVQTNPLVVCDTGHNLAGWQHLAPQIIQTWRHVRKQHTESRLRMVFGMVDDKDIDAVMHLLPQEAAYYFTQAETHRAIPATRVAEIAHKHELTGTTFASVSTAFNAALAASSEHDMIFVGGSSYVVADFLATYKLSADSNKR